MSTNTLAQQPVMNPKLILGEEKQELIIADKSSISSSTTLGSPELFLTPVKSLHINNRGIAVLRLPLPSSELETSVHNSNGSLAYKSTRSKRSSGSCVLTDAHGKPLISTTYYFGPSRDPVLTRLDAAEGTLQEIKTMSKWTSRNHTFLLPDGRMCTWKYRRERGFGATDVKSTGLVMSLGERRIAALIRNEETRTPGSKSCSAGNGGELALSNEINSTDGVGEELVVATCLLMLKKEVDRRRTIQFMSITAAASC